MTVAIVTIPVADLRREPDHRSERMSQLSYGHKVRILDEQNGFLHVSGEDEYTGWMHSAYTADFTLTEAEAQVVSTPIALIHLEKSKESLLLPYGAMVAFDRRTEVCRDWKHSEKVAIRQGFLLPQKPLTVPELLAEARTLCGVPYLWGGTSGFGFDCSGFVQTLFRRLGIQLPRDSKDQEKVGVAVKSEASSGGDLFFFPGHVALHLGEMNIIHTSRLRGCVAIDSLNKKSSRYREDLANSITAIRKVPQ
jgi:cell wall-associated NlpC family hydrolase